MRISHIFFDLHGTIIDRVRSPWAYAAGVGLYMAERFGGEAAVWERASLRIVEDWDSYHADLDFGGDDGIDQVYESEFRKARALFRLAGRPEPGHDALTTLARTLPERATERGGSVLYPEARGVIEALYAAGSALGTASHALQGQVRGLLRAGGVLDRFRAPLFGCDLAERFRKDETYFQIIGMRVGAEPSACLLVDDDLGSIRSARAVGMRTVHVSRDGRPAADDADLVLYDGLEALPAWLHLMPGQDAANPI